MIGLFLQWWNVGDYYTIMLLVVIKLHQVFGFWPSADDFLTKIFSCKILNLEQDGWGGSFMVVIHATLVACNLYLLISFITHGWASVAPVLLTHPKVHILFFHYASGCLLLSLCYYLLANDGLNFYGWQSTIEVGLNAG